jgi:hypothetical protein
MDEDAEMALAFAFPDPSDSFVHGYEAGKVASRLEAGELEVDQGVQEGFPLHEENLDLFRRMAAYYGYSVETGAAVDGWVPVRFNRSARPKPALSIVP